MPILGQEGGGWRGDQVDQGAQLVRQVACEVAVEAHDLLGAVARIEDRAGGHGRADRVQIELEGGDDAEIASAAAQAPEEVGVLRRARGEDLAVGGDHLGRAQVVAGQAVLAHQPADPAAQREAGDAGGRDQAPGSGESVLLGRRVELPPGDAALGGGGAAAHIHRDALHRREVDDDAVVAGREAGNAVAAAAHGDVEPLAAREADCVAHVGGIGAAGDHRRAGVMGAVPDRTSLVVGAVAGPDQLSVQPVLELLQRCRSKHSLRSHAGPLLSSVV